MNLIKIKKVFVLVLTLAWNQVRSQDDVIPVVDGGPGARSIAIQQPSPGRTVWFVNGPMEISVEAEEQRSGGIGRFINGPTGISVEAEQQSRNQASSFVNGPTGISVDAEEHISNQDPRFVGMSAGISHHVEQQADEVTYDTIDNTGSPVTGEQEQTRSSSRGVFSPDPGDDRLKQQLPPGLYIDTADWSKDSAHWSFKGGDWSLVDLPDPAHPDLPAPVLPGPALLVVTQEFLKKVYIKREVKDLTNVTLHYRFYLSQGDGPHGVPELKVYQATDKSQLLASEMARGSWLDRTLHLPGPVPFTIVFEGRLNKEGNEIALDDVTISGISEGEVGHGERDLLQDNIPVIHNLNTTTKETTGVSEVQEASPKNATKFLELSDEIVKKMDNISPKTEVKTPRSNFTTETHVDDAQVTSTAGEDVAENSTELVTIATAMHVSPEDHGNTYNESPEQIQTTTVDSSDVIQTTIQSFTEGSELIHEFNDKDAFNFTADDELNKEENYTTGAPFITDGEKVIGETEEVDYNSLDIGKISGENETVHNTTRDLEPRTGDSETLTFISTTSSNLHSGINITEELRETTLAYNDTNETEDTTINNFNPQPTTGYSPNQPTLQTTLSLNNTTLSPTINTEPTVYLQTSQRTSMATVDAPRGTQSPKSTPEISRSSQSTTGFMGSIIPWGISSKSTTMKPSYTSPSGGMTSTSEMSEEMHVSKTSWGIFQFFLALCLVGLIALGFLYWRKKRRQDDEIPVFTRSSYADYHNPTFTPEDDANFPSRGPRHNYKSFE